MSDYKQRVEERRNRMMAKPLVSYSGGPVFSEDTNRYYHDLQSCIEDYWDAGTASEDALVFECYTELAHTPDLVDVVDEAWGDELEDWDGMSSEAEKILSDAWEAVAQLAPTIWYPDYNKRLEFTFSDGGFDPSEFEAYNDNVEEL